MRTGASVAVVCDTSGGMRNWTVDNTGDDEAEESMLNKPLADGAVALEGAGMGVMDHPIGLEGHRTGPGTRAGRVEAWLALLHGT